MITERGYNIVKVSMYLCGVKITYKSVFPTYKLGVTKDMVRRVYGMKGPFDLM